MFLHFELYLIVLKGIFANPFISHGHSDYFFKLLMCFKAGLWLHCLTVFRKYTNLLMNLKSASRTGMSDFLCSVLINSVTWYDIFCRCQGKFNINQLLHLLVMLIKEFQEHFGSFVIKQEFIFIDKGTTIESDIF